MLNEKGPKPFQLIDLAEKRAERRKLSKEREASRHILLEGVEPASIVRMRAKAIRIVTAAPENERYAAAAHIDQMMNAKQPKELLEELEKLAPSPEGVPSTHEIELAMAVLIVTDEDN